MGSSSSSLNKSAFRTDNMVTPESPTKDISSVEKNDAVVSIVSNSSPSTKKTFDADVRLARRIRRDTVERGRDIDSVLEQYAKFVKPAFDDFVLPSKKYADVIIPRGGDNHVAVDLIVQHIHTKLGQHDLCKIYPNVFVIQSTFQIRGMHTLIREKDISKHDFVFYSDRLIRLVVEHGLGHLPFTEKQVVTPTGAVYSGVDFCKKLCGVSVIRRIRRDTVERGRDIDSVLEQYAKFVKPAFDDFVLPSKKYADVIIPRGGDNHVAVDLIVQHIHTKLGQHDLCKIYPNVFVIQSTFQIRGMHTLIREKDISKHDFVFYSDRLIRLVVEHGLGHLPFTEKQVVTPTGIRGEWLELELYFIGAVYSGVDFCKKLCGVSVIRSGESMENALRACCKGIKIGKILIHRVGDNGMQLIYEKLPSDISERHVLLMDPVLGTGNFSHCFPLMV
ncbi:hypothetical protein F2Q69_00024531 [Brassica cretica]|uniref:Uracil phosphoribosyltransferase n=1 Tax=Brassica cretica TaxID=69181 RepID=A0A8S9QAZ9_BRACR|nr:hypothetical protein F2Q69_00024531 [Brassica cretica]